MQHPAPQKGAKPFLQRIQSAPPEGKEQVFQKSYVMGQELQKSYQLQGKLNPNSTQFNYKPNEKSEAIEIFQNLPKIEENKNNISIDSKNLVKNDEKKNNELPKKKLKLSSNHFAADVSFDVNSTLQTTKNNFPPLAQINEHIKPSNSQETLKKASSPIQNQSIFQNPAIEKNPIIGGIVNNSKPAEIKKKITMKLSTNSQSFYAGNNLENPAAEKKNEKIEKIEENNNSYNEIKSNKDLEKKLENIEKENKEMEEMLKNNSLKEIRENQKKEENLKKEGNDKKQLIIKKEEVEELKKQEEILKIQEETLKKQKILEEEKKIEEIIIPEKRLYKPFIKNIIELGRKSRIRENIPEYLRPYLKRECLIMDSYTKKIKKEEIPKEKDIERSNITQNNQSQNSKTEDLMFIQRAPENEKKKEIKENLNKFTQHFKELSKNDDKKFKNNITLNLNILTPDNFIKVKDILLDLVKGNKDGIAFLVDKIIEKAWTEVKYTRTYADLCSFLQNSKDLLEDNTEESKSKAKNLFKSLLFGRIQNAFENQDDQISKGENKESVSELLKIKKKKIIGNVQFIGELFLTKVVPLKVINICSNILLKNFINHYQFSLIDSNSNTTKEYEIDIEAIINLFEKVGKNVDKEKTEKNKKEDHSEKETALITDTIKVLKTIEKSKVNNPNLTNFGEISINNIFATLKLIRENLSINSRIKALIENLLERKKEQWKDKLFANEGPKTLDQLHKEYEQEQEQIERRANQYRENEYNNNDYSHRSRPVNVYTQKQAPSFQVVSDITKKKDEEKKVDTPKETNSNKVKMSLNFSLNRDNVIKDKLSTNEISEKTNSLFKKINEFPEITEDLEKKISEEFALILKNCNHNTFLEFFFSKFYDEKIELVEKRLWIISRLHSENLISRDEFLREFNNFLLISYSIGSDVPYLAEWLAKIYWKFIQNKIFTFNDLLENQKIDDEDILDYLKEFVDKIFKIVLLNNSIELYKEDLSKLIRKLNMDLNYFSEKYFL